MCQFPSSAGVTSALVDGSAILGWECQLLAVAVAGVRFAVSVVLSHVGISPAESVADGPCLCMHG